ncbi:MAG TPA: hypothetical protein VGK50_06545 [Coriobacteriia bacterium]
MKRGIRTAICAGLLLALALSAGCARIAENAARGAVEKATGVKVDEKSNQVTVTGKDGKAVTFTGGDKKLPDNLPKDFPVYAGTPEGGASAASNEGSTFTLAVVTTDKVADVFGWYKKELAGNGWSIENSATVTVDGKQSASLSAKKNTMEAVVTIGSDSSADGKVRINAIINDKKK